MRDLPQPDFKSLFESAPGLYLVLLPDFTIIAVSEAYLQATMTRREDIIGRHLFDVFPDNPDDSAATGVANLRSSLNYVLRHHTAHTMAVQKYDIRRPDGSFEERFWSPLNKPVFNGKKEISCIIHRVEDVTGFIKLRKEQNEINEELRGRVEEMEMEIYKRAQEIQESNQKLLNEIKERRYAEKRIREAEERFRLLVSNVKDYAIFMVSLEGQILSWNEGAERIKGYNTNEVIGQPISIFYPPDDVARGVPLANLETARKKGRYETEGWRIRKDGSRFWANVVFTALYDKAGNLRGLAKMTRDITERKQLEDRLKKMNEELEKQVLDKTEEIRRSYEDLRLLASHLQDVREEERATMSREIHDQLGQQLTGLKMDVSWLSKKIQTDDELIRDKIKGIMELLDGTIRMVRRIATELRPSILDDLGLIEAMKWQSYEFEKRSEIKIDFNSSLSEVSFPNNVTIALFRIYQESLTNVARHAGATKVSTAIHQEDHRLVLIIADNGKGFDTRAISHKRTLGIMGMRERAMMIGGHYDIISEPGKGTTVSIMVPLTEEEDEQKNAERKTG